MDTLGVTVLIDDYPMLGGRTMTDKEEQSPKEAKRVEKRAAEELGRLAKEQARRKASLDREQAIAEARDARRLKESENQPPE